MRLILLHWSFRLEGFRRATKDRSLGRSLPVLAEKYRSNSDLLSNFEEMNENHKYLRNRFPYLEMLGFLGFQVELRETCREPVLGVVGLSTQDECNYTSRYERFFSLPLRIDGLTSIFFLLCCSQAPRFRTSATFFRLR
jgi:hypothetical protein